MSIYTSKKRTQEEFIALGSKKLWDELKKVRQRQASILFALDKKDHALATKGMGEKRRDQTEQDVATLRSELKEAETDAEMIFRAIPAAEFREDIAKV